MLRRWRVVSLWRQTTCTFYVFTLLGACSGSTDPDAVPTRIEILGAGPSASNLTFASPRFSPIANGVEIVALTGTPSSNFTFAVEARRVASVGVETIRVVIRPREGEGLGLDTLWYWQYRATLMQLRPGEYEVVLVYAYRGFPEREEARSLVQVP